MSVCFVFWVEARGGLSPLAVGVCIEATTHQQSAAVELSARPISVCTYTSLSSTVLSSAAYKQAYLYTA